MGSICLEYKIIFVLQAEKTEQNVNIKRISILSIFCTNHSFSLSVKSYKRNNIILKSIRFVVQITR